MATHKRRVIYLSDEQWGAAKHGASVSGESISGYIGSLLVGERGAVVSIRQVGRREERFNSRPFQPVPKR